MKKIVLMTFLAGISAVSYAGPAKSPANAFSYNFIEGQYVDMSNIDVDNKHDFIPFNDKVSANISGLRIKGSFDVAPSFSVIGSVLDAGNNKNDLTIVSIGGAYHQALPKIANMPFDLILRAEIEHVSDDGGSDTGVVLGGGVQMAIINKLRAFSDVSVSSNHNRGLSLSVGARYEFVKSLEAIAAVQVGDLDMLSTGIRYNF